MEEQQNNWIGRTLSGRYEILEVIGTGGMGVIFRARQLSVDRMVAIKMMHAQASRSQESTERFQSEARACSRLTHPNTVRLFDFGQTTLGNFYMVMELLQGRSLREVLAIEAPLPASRVLRILMQCAASLAEAHAAGIIHRDLKPENIFLADLAGAPDFVKLLDFSIAKVVDARMTAVGTVVGTPQYMSPEQASGKPIDGRSDVYALGVVAYAMLTNALPFHDPDPLAVLKMHISSPVPPLPAHVPDTVAKVVVACLQKNPEQRPASAMALLEACKVWLTTLDPTLDLASDPVLRNTLIQPTRSEEPAADTNAQTQSMRVAQASNKTMLSASGKQRLSANEASSAPLRNAPTASIGSTLVHASAVAPKLVAPTPTASAKAVLVPTALPLSSAPIPTPLPLMASVPVAAPAPMPSAPMPSAPSDTPDSTRAPISRIAPARTPALAVTTPLPRAVLSHATPQPLPQESSQAAFIFACCLVALTFGLGGYYITWALR